MKERADKVKQSMSNAKEKATPFFKAVGEKAKAREGHWEDRGQAQRHQSWQG